MAGDVWPPIGAMSTAGAGPCPPEGGPASCAVVAEIEAQPAGTAAGDADGGAAAEATRRRDALARLASGVAHDLNNILAALSVELELLAGAPELPAQLREDLALARTALDRGATLTRQLQAFGRRLPARPRRCVPPACSRRVRGSHHASPSPGSDTRKPRTSTGR